MKETVLRRIAVFLCLIFMLTGIAVVQSVAVDTQYVMAEELGEDFVVEDEGEEDYEDSGGSEGSDGLTGNLDSDDEGVADFIGNHRGMTDSQLRLASRTLSPLTNLIGNCIGGIIVLAAFGLFVMTAADLLYIAFPPIRPLLYTGAQQQGGAMGGMGGMGTGGYGMRGGMGMGGAQQPKIRQWISDEAVQCAAMMGGAQQQGGAMGGMEMGGYGMGGMGGMGMQGQDSQANVKSVIGTYFKKRIVFMILFAICVVVLMSSKLLGTGVNLAAWLLKLLDTLNAYMP